MSNAPEEDKHASKPALMLDCDAEEAKERPKGSAKPSEEDLGAQQSDCVDQRALIQQDFEKYIRDNKELNMAELSFDTTTPNAPPIPSMPGSRAAAEAEDPAEQHEMALSQFSLGAPPVQQSHDPSLPSEATPGVLSTALRLAQ